jgi:hypothetical protein
VAVVDVSTGETKKATRAEFKGDTGATGPQGPTGAAGSAAASTIRKGLALHLPMDFASANGTTAYDQAAASNFGTATGPTFLPTGGPDSNGAWDFDGVDDYIEVPHHVNQLLVNGMSISAWVKPDTIGESNGYIIDKSTSTSAGGGFALLTAGTLNRVGFRVNSFASTRTSATNSVTPGDGLWHHVVVTAAADGTINFYVDGVLSGTPNQTGGPLSGITTANPIRIGNRSTATDRTFDGGIANLRLYSRVISTAEITELFTNKL